MKTYYPTRPPQLLLFIILIIILFLLSSCGVQKNYSEMYKEDLTYLPTIHDRLIIGIEKGIIFKNRTYYKVINKHGKPEPKIYEPDSILYKEKGILLCLDEFKY